MLKKVFISYAHESKALSDNVLEFSNFLRTKGIDSEIDQYEESPPEGWPKWMMRQIQEADYVLVVCSEAFYNRANDLSGSDDGLGVKWETTLILQQLYSLNSQNTKFIPVIFNKENSKYIPLPLQPYTYYLLSDTQIKNQLTNRLKGISTSKKPPLGVPVEAEESLAPKERKTMFFSSIIDVDLWNKALWSGMVFLSDPALKAPPIVGFMFENEEYGEKIFSNLKAQFGDVDVNEEIHLSFIRAISKEKQNYKVHLGTSFEVMEDKIKKQGLSPEETFFVGLSRVHTMTPPEGSTNLGVFEHSFKFFKRYGITNVIKSGDSIRPNFDNVIMKKKVNFRTKDEVLSDKDHIDQPAFAKEK